jgi:hypothetical protein
VWSRELLTVDWPPEISHDHRESRRAQGEPSDDVFAHHAFFFGPGEYRKNLQHVRSSF